MPIAQPFFYNAYFINLRVRKKKKKKLKCDDSFTLGSDKERAHRV